MPPAVASTPHIEHSLPASSGGRPAQPRPIELLWSEGSPAKLGNRLSVLLSMVHNALQPSS
jgi:hypothetical protein